MTLVPTMLALSGDAGHGSLADAVIAKATAAPELAWIGWVLALPAISAVLCVLCAMFQIGRAHV